MSLPGDVLEISPNLYDENYRGQRKLLELPFSSTIHFLEGGVPYSKYSYPKTSLS